MGFKKMTWFHGLAMIMGVLFLVGGLSGIAAAAGKKPIIFADFGWAGDGSDWPGGGSSADVLWSVGGGVSVLNGFFRAELVSPKFEQVRFEMYFAGAL